MKEIKNGVWPVMITPFTADNQIDFDAVKAIIPAGAETELKVGMLFAILFPIGMIAGMALLKKMTKKS